MPRGIRLNSILAEYYHNLGLSDQGIGSKIGAHKKSVARWRRELNLPSNVKQGRPKTQGSGWKKC